MAFIVSIAPWLEWVALILGVAASFYASLRFVHMLQLESYQANMYLKWLGKNAWRDWLPTGLVFLICIEAGRGADLCDTLAGLRPLPGDLCARQFAVRLLFAGLMLLIGVTWRRQPAKKPLVFTGRVKRLCAALVLLMFLLGLYPYLFEDGIVFSVGRYLFERAAVYLPALLLPLLVLLAHYCTYPIEEANKRRYFNDAKHRLEERHDLIKIGITGSFGKTSTKFILGTLLSQGFNTLITPQSYNTPMGVTRVARGDAEARTRGFCCGDGGPLCGGY